MNSGEEALTLTAERTGGRTRLVRRRAAPPGMSTPPAALALRDPVVLLEGRFDIDFSYGAFSEDGKLTWRNSWSNPSKLPRLVRLNLRDRSNGSNALMQAEFAVRADAPSACAAADASTDCLSSAAETSPAPSVSGREKAR